MNKISIIIPIYNTSKFLSKCLESILSQTYTNWECILIDDCSTDNSYEILKEYSIKDKRFVLYRNDKNLGVGETRKFGISKANGDYISFIDSDDYIESTFLEELLNACIVNDADASICGTKNRDINYNYLGQDVAENNEVIEDKDYIIDLYFNYSWFCQYHVNKLVKSSIIKSVEYIPYIMSEDSANCIKHLLACNRIVIINKSLYNYIRYSESTCTTVTIDKIIDKIIVGYNHYLMFKEMNKTDYIEKIKAYIKHLLMRTIIAIDVNDVRYSKLELIKKEMELYK